MFGFFDPLPLVCIFTQPPLLSFLTASAFGVPPSPSLCRHHMYMPLSLQWQLPISETEGERKEKMSIFRRIYDGFYGSISDSFKGTKSDDDCGGGGKGCASTIRSPNVF